MRKRAITVVVVLCAALVGAIAYTVLSPGPRKEAKTVRVGIVLPLSGSAEQLGKACRDGYELAHDDMRKTPAGTQGIAFQLLYEDSQAEGKLASSAGKKLVTLDKVDVLMCLTTTETSVLAPIAKENKIVLLSGTLTPGIANAQDYVFRNAPALDRQALGVLSYAISEKGLKKFALLGLQLDAHLRVEKSLREELPRKGGEIVAVENGEKGATDFRAQILKALQAKPDAIYVMGYDETGHMMKQARELGYKGPFFGDPAVASPSALEKAGTAAEGIIYATAEITGPGAPANARTFGTRYEKRFGKAPDVFAADAYDSLHIIALAATRLREAHDDWREALLSIREYQGVTGTTSFLPNGDVEKPVALKVIKNGKPAPLAAAE